MKGTEARQLVASLLAMPDGWIVHDEPTSDPGSPAVVIAPRRPFRTLRTGCIEDVGLAVTLVLNLATEDVWALMDDLVELVRDQLEQDGRVAVESVEDMGTVLNIGGVDHMTARLDVAVAMT